MSGLNRQFWHNFWQKGIFSPHHTRTQTRKKCQLIILNMRVKWVQWNVFYHLTHSRTFLPYIFPSTYLQVILGVVCVYVCVCVWDREMEREREKECFYVCLSACVCVCVLVWLCVCVCMCVCMWKKRARVHVSVFDRSPLFFFRDIPKTSSYLIASPALSSFR